MTREPRVRSSWLAQLRGRMVMSGLLGVLVFVIGWRHCDHAAEIQPLWVEPSGYVDIVNQGMRNDLTTLPRPAEEIDDDLGAPQDGSATDEPTDPVQETTEPVSRFRQPRLKDVPSPAKRKFLASSFLLEDLEHPDRFEVVRSEEQEVRLLGFHRRRPLPFAQDSSWRGRVLYRGSEARPTIRTRGGLVVQFSPPPESKSNKPQVIRIGEALGDDSTLVLTGHDFEFHGANGLEFRLFTIPSPSSTHFRPPTVLIRRPKQATTTLRHNGERVGNDLKALNPGDWLVYRDAYAQEVFQLQSGTSGVLSDWRRGPQGGARTFVDSDGLTNLVRALAGVMDRVVSFSQKSLNQTDYNLAAEPPADASRLQDTDLELTIDSVTQRAAQAVLDRNIHRRMGRTGWSYGGYARQLPRAALVVTEIRTGEVWAAASYPQPSHIDDHLDRLRLASNRPLADAASLRAQRQRQRATSHDAFTLHQVGSTTKPLFAAAVALGKRVPQMPDPLNLTLAEVGRDQGDFNGEGGVRGSKSWYQLGEFDDGWQCRSGINFRQFLANSCNRYMFKLGALALEAQESRGEHPASSQEDPANACRFRKLDNLDPQTPSDARELTPIEMLRWMSDAQVRNPNSRPWDTTVWGELDERVRRLVGTDLGCLPLPGSVRLDRISPESVDLNTDNITKCDPEFSSLLKGGFTNRWSNVALTAAYARFLTGRKIEPTLLRNVRDTDEPVLSTTLDPRPIKSTNCAESLACGNPQRYETVRNAVLGGMGDALSAGTARSLSGLLGSSKDSVLKKLEEATGNQWGAYAKTGSSVRELSIVRAVNARLEPTRQSKWKAPVANFVMMLVECEDKADAPREHPIACTTPPRVGSTPRGFVLHAWVDAVPYYSQGSRAARLLLTAEGQALLATLVQAAGVR